MPKTVRGGKATARFPPGAATVRFFHQLADERERLQEEANERRRRDHEAFIARMNIPVNFNPHRETKRKRGEGIVTSKGQAKNNAAQQRAYEDQQNQFKANLAAEKAMKVNSDAIKEDKARKREEAKSVDEIKLDLKGLVSEYENAPEDKGVQDRLLKKLGQLEQRAAADKHSELLRRAYEVGGKKLGLFEGTENMVNKGFTWGVGHNIDLNDLDDQDLEEIISKRVDAKRRKDAPWYEQIGEVFKTAVVPAIGDVANILGKVIPGASLITDEIEKVTNHGVHSWDDLGFLGNLIEIAPNLARQVIPTSQIGNVLEAYKAAKDLGTQSSQLDDEHTGGRINPFKHHYRSIKRTKRI